MKIKNLISYTVSLEHIPYLWEQNDILIFIIDLNDYDTLNADDLDKIEKEHLERLQTGYFKKRFVVSRTVLKHILCCLLNEGSLSDVSLYKDKYGRIHVHGHDELNICVSYTEDVVFLAISKIETGIDVEVRRYLSLKNVSKYLQTETSSDGRCATNLKFLEAWTLKEAYCKFSNKSILSYLNKVLDTNDIHKSSYLINNKYILAVVTVSDHYAINISCFEKIFYD